jgi:hypothetical protein
MTGVTWIVQTVTDPLFTLVARDGFPAYAPEHQRRVV